MTKRIKWLDFGKGATIVGVVLCHSTAIPMIVGYLLSAFMMPVFFAISGYLYKPTDTIAKFKLMFYKKFVGLVIPYIIFGIIAALMEHIHNISLIIHDWYQIIIFPCGWLWFLEALFIIFIIVGLMNLFHVPLYIIFILALAWGEWPAKQLSVSSTNLYPIGGWTNPFAVIGMDLICFLFGYVLKHYNLTKYLYNKKRNIVLLGFYFLFIIISYTYSVSASSMDLHLISIVVCFSAFINWNHASYVFNYFVKYGKFTLLIYLVHWPIVMVLLPKIYIKFGVYNLIHTHSISILSFIQFILVWFISIFVCFLAKKFGIVNFIAYPRKFLDKVVLKTHWGKRLFNN